MNAKASRLQALEAALAPLIAGMGLELVTVEGGGSGGILRLYIDRAEDGPALTFADCERVSQVVGDWLDAEVGDAPTAAAGEAAALLAGPYTLEVSTPGLDRPLCRPAHFCRFVGREVSLHLAHPVGDGGRRRLSGRLARAAAEEGGAIWVETVDLAVRVDYPSITRARLVPDYGDGPPKERHHGR